MLSISRLNLTLAYSKGQLGSWNVVSSNILAFLIVTLLINLRIFLSCLLNCFIAFYQYFNYSFNQYLSQWLIHRFVNKIINHLVNRKSFLINLTVNVLKFRWNIVCSISHLIKINSVICDVIYYSMIWQRRQRIWIVSNVLLHNTDILNNSAAVSPFCGLIIRFATRLILYVLVALFWCPQCSARHTAFYCVNATQRLDC